MANGDPGSDPRLGHTREMPVTYGNDGPNADAMWELLNAGNEVPSNDPSIVPTTVGNMEGYNRILGYGNVGLVDGQRPTDTSIYGDVSSSVYIQVRNLATKWMNLIETGALASSYSAIAGFLEELRSTQWWNEYDETWRAAELLRWDDPETWESNQEIYREDVVRIAQNIGLELDPENAAHAEIIEDLVYEWSHAGENYGQADVERHIFDNYSGTDGQWTGDVGTQTISVGTVKDEADRIRRKLQDNMLPVNESWIWKQAKGVITEQWDSSIVDQRIYNQVSTHFAFLDSDFGQRLNASGMDLVDEKYGLLTSAQTTLEDTTIDWTHDIFKDSLTIKDETGNATRFATPNEIERAARAYVTNEGRHLYKETDQYKSNMKKTKNALYSVFGVV